MSHPNFSVTADSNQPPKKRGRPSNSGSNKLERKQINLDVDANWSFMFEELKTHWGLISNAETVRKAIPYALEMVKIFDDPNVFVYTKHKETGEVEKIKIVNSKY